MRMGLPLNISPKTHLLIVSWTRARAASVDSLPDSPHIDGSSIFPKLKQELRWPVPTGNDKARVISKCLPATSPGYRWWFIVGSGKTKICNLKDTLVID